MVYVNGSAIKFAKVDAGWFAPSLDAMTFAIKNAKVGAIGFAELEGDSQSITATSSEVTWVLP